MAKLGDETSVGLNRMLGGDWIGVVFEIGVPLIIGVMIGRATAK
jgi:hypothetical protein